MGKNPDHLVKSNNIIYLGQRSHEECLEIYSQADWMIHLAWLDHCPNVVVEALSQNCPVICSDSGGTKELVKDNGIIIPELIPYEYQLCDYDSPTPLNLNDIELKEIKVENGSVDIRLSAKKYISLFKKIIRSTF